MTTTTVRISEHARDIVRELAQSTGVSMQDIIEQAIEAYRRERFMAELNAGYAALRNDPEAWQSYRDELAEWDVTLSDGLEDY